MKINKLDADEQLFFSRQLESLKSRTYDVQYPTLKARQLFPVSFEAGPGAESIVYRQYDQVGMAKVIANYADDLPRADVKGKEFPSVVKSLGASYGYNLQEIRSAAKANLPLQQRRASAARRAVLQAENNIAFFGDSENGLPGFLSNPNIPSDSVPADGTGSSTLFKDKDPDKVLRDMNTCVQDVLDNSNGVEVPNVLLLPLAQFGDISTRRVTDTNITILSYFLANNPHIRSVEWANELKGAGSGGEDIMVAYDRNPDKLTLEIPSDFEQLPVEPRGLEFVVNTHQRIGGVIIYYPLSVNIAEGI